MVDKAPSILSHSFIKIISSCSYIHKFSEKKLQIPSQEELYSRLRFQVHGPKAIYELQRDILHPGQQIEQDVSFKQIRKHYYW